MKGELKKSLFSAIIPNYIFNDERLSLKDIGMLCYLINLDLISFTPTVALLEKNLKNDGRESIITAIRHLEEFGYLNRKRNKWTLNIIYDADKFEIKSRLILQFKSDIVARTQNWTESELIKIQPAILKLEEEYDYSVVYTAFRYSINGIQKKIQTKEAINDRVAYIIKSIQNGCKAIIKSIVTKEMIKEDFDNISEKIFDVNEGWDVL